VSPGVGSALQRRCAVVGIGRDRPDRVGGFAAPCWACGGPRIPAPNPIARPEQSTGPDVRRVPTYVPVIRRDTIRIT
jgi:hypothetical protein